MSRAEAWERYDGRVRVNLDDKGEQRAFDAGWNAHKAALEALVKRLGCSPLPSHGLQDAVCWALEEVERA